MLSLVIVSYNARDVLRACLASVRMHEPQAEVIVVDNASRDGSVDVVRAEFPEVTLVASPKNLGFAAANNAGLALATRPTVVLLNSDTELTDDSLSRCARRLAADPTLGAVHPLLRGADGMPQAAEYRMPSLKAAIRSAARLAPRADSQGETPWLPGTALVLRRTALEDIGGLDAGYFIYWEDADLSARLRRAGWGLAVEPTAEVRHIGGASGGGPDAARRADLYAWYCYGKHRWFRRNRPAWEAAGVWLLDAAEVPRKILRGLRYSARRRVEWAHARVTVRVLALGLLGMEPSRP